MPYTPNTTWVDGPAGGTPLSAARLNNLEAGVTITYDAFTPTWGSTGTSPALGNGTLVGRFVQRGKFVQGRIRLTIGSTSTFGTGTYTLTLPVTAAAVTNGAYIGVGAFNDAGAEYMGLAKMFSTGTLIMFGTANPAVAFSGTTPVTWATGDIWEVTFTYEAA